MIPRGTAIRTRARYSPPKIFLNYPVSVGQSYSRDLRPPIKKQSEMILGQHKARSGINIVRVIFMFFDGRVTRHNMVRFVDGVL